MDSLFKTKCLEEDKEMKKKFRSFEDARKFVRKLGFKGETEWRKYCKSGIKPEDIPSAPWTVYRDKGWKSMGEWLGTGRVADQFKQYRPFKVARAFVHSLGLKGQREWYKYCKSGKKPDDIPAGPVQTYENEWIHWRDWLGSTSIPIRNVKWRSFERAREYVQSLKLRSVSEWIKFSKSRKLPDDIPRSPRRQYKKQWKSWGDWLGTGTIAPFNMVYRPFPEAKEFFRSLKLKNRQEWIDFVKSGKKPDDIPAAPWMVYTKENVWRKMKKK